MKQWALTLTALRHFNEVRLNKKVWSLFFIYFVNKKDAAQIGFGKTGFVHCGKQPQKLSTAEKRSNATKATIATYNP